MTPRFILPRGYEPRRMVLALSREGRGWRFYGVAFDQDGRNAYAVRACNPKGEPLCGSTVFATQREAATMADALGLPAYAVWNGRTRRYQGLAFEAVAEARQ